MKGILKNRFIEIYSNNLKSQLINKGFGNKQDNYLEIDFFEGLFLLEKNKMKIYLDNKIILKKDFISYSEKKIKNFKEKYIVYKDFKEKGYIIKDGAIFGFDFRIYEGKTKKHEHTKYVVDVKKTHKDEMSQIIKSERLANSINAEYVIAIIDMDQKIIKIKIKRI